MGNRLRNEAKRRHKVQSASWSRLRTRIVYQIGMTNRWAFSAVMDAIDAIEEDIVEGSDTAKVVEYANIVMEYEGRLIRKMYDDDERKVSFYYDACVHCSGSMDPYINKMKDSLVAYLEGVGTTNVEKKAMITIAWLLLQTASVVYQGCRKKVKKTCENFDISRVIGGMELTLLFKEWEKIVREHATMPEAEESVDVFSVDGFQEAFNAFVGKATEDDFFDTELRWAALLNKEHYPEIYNEIIEGDERGEYESHSTKE